MITKSGIVINRYVGKLPLEVEAEVIQLAMECGIDEEYDTDCDLVFTWLKDGKIVAVIAFYLQLFSDGRLIPRWEHIFYHRRVRTTKKAYEFIQAVTIMVGHVYKQIWAYVTPEKEFMMKYALKFGFQPYSTSPEGQCLVYNYSLKGI